MSRRNGDRDAAHAFMRRRQEALGATRQTPPLDDVDAPIDALPDAVCLSDAPTEEPVAWLYPGMIPRAEPMLVAGPEGEMKTTWTLLLACATAAGGQFMGHTATTTGPVLLVSGEDSRGIIDNRCRAICRGHGWNPDHVLRRVHFIDADGADLTHVRWQRHLIGQVERLAPVLVALDPLANLVSGDENGARPSVRALWRALTKPSGATVALVHHAGKKGDGTRSKRDRIRGHTDIVAASRATFFIEREASGIVIDNIKQSRGLPTRPFVLDPYIESDPRNRGVWTIAQFEKRNLRQATLSHAESWLLEFLVTYPGATTAQIREGAKSAGVSQFDAQKAHRSLEDGGLLAFDPGPRGAKFWRLADTEDRPNDPARQGRDTDPADPAGTLPGQGASDASDPACRPYKAGQGQRAASDALGRVDDEDDQYASEERRALKEGL